MNILDIKLQHYFKAVHLLQQCCLSITSTTIKKRHTNVTIDSYKDMYRYFRHQPATEQCCSLAVAVLFVKYFSNESLLLINQRRYDFDTSHVAFLWDEEIMYGLSLDAMTFDLGLRSKAK